jgi:hypothetical protein
VCLAVMRLIYECLNIALSRNPLKDQDDNDNFKRFWRLYGHVVDLHYIYIVC